MRLLIDRTLHWWEICLLKVSLISLGIVIGVTWFDFFNLRDGLYILFWVLFILPAVYFIITQIKLWIRS